MLQRLPALSLGRFDEAAKLQIFQHGHAGKQASAFRNDGNAVLTKLVTWQGRDVFAIEAQRAAAGLVQTGNGVDQRGFAGTVGAHHTDQLARLHLQADAP